MTTKEPSQEAIEAGAIAICQTGKHETGQGTCAAICMEQLGDARKRPCQFAAKIHGASAKATILAYHKHLVSKEPWVVIDGWQRCRARVKVVADRLLKSYQADNPDDGVGGFGKDWRHFVGRAQRIVDALDAAPEVFG